MNCTDCEVKRRHPVAMCRHAQALKCLIVRLIKPSFYDPVGFTEEGEDEESQAGARDGDEPTAPANLADAAKLRHSGYVSPGVEGRQVDL